MTDKYTDPDGPMLDPPTPDDMSRQLAALPDGVERAIDAMFELCDAIGSGITTNDLAAGCRLAIEDGHDMALLQLEMMQQAIIIAGTEVQNDQSP